MKKIFTVLLLLIVSISIIYYLYQQSTYNKIYSLEESQTINKPTKCLFSKPNSYSEVINDGENYWSKTVENGRAGYVIKNSLSTYIWTEGEAKGIKVDNLEKENIDDITHSNLATNNSLYFESLGYNVECKLIKDNSFQFKPPDGINFIEPELIGR